MLAVTFLLLLIACLLVRKFRLSERPCPTLRHHARHSGTRRPNSGLPESGYFICPSLHLSKSSFVQVFICPSRQQPTWMARARNPFDHVLGREMDSGLDARACHRARIRATRWRRPGMTTVGMAPSGRLANYLPGRPSREKPALTRPPVIAIEGCHFRLARGSQRARLWAARQAFPGTCEASQVLRVHRD